MRGPVTVALVAVAACLAATAAPRVLATKWIKKGSDAIELHLIQQQQQQQQQGD